MIPSPRKHLRREFKEDELHIAVLTGKLKKVKEFLRRGVHIESVNSDGQTPLFCASFGGDLEVVDLLLRLGANPNRKCGSSGASPVHAAAFRGSRRVLRLLVEYGGDLFGRDIEFLTPRDYALKQQAPHRQQKIIEFLDFLESFAFGSMGQGNMEGTLSPAASTTTMLTEPTSGTLKSKKSLFSSQMSLSRKISPSTSNIWAGCIGDNVDATALLSPKFPTREVELTANLQQSVSCHLLNNLCVTTSLPLLSPMQLHRPKVPTTAYTCGGPTVYSQYIWLGTPVTVRRPTPLLSIDNKDSNAIDGIAPDPEAIKCLLNELSLLRRLRHPSFIEVMAACHVTSPSPDHVTLVYQHVPYGSLYHHLHVQHHDLLVGSAVDMLIGIIEALLFMHAHGWLHCGLSSHSIHLVTLRNAKLGGFEYAMESHVKGVGMRAHYLSKAAWLKPWQAPETIVEDMVSVRSEVYSIAVIIWEIWAGMAPWFGIDDSEVSKHIKDGDFLPHLEEVPSLISYLTEYGLKWNEHEREIGLQEIHTLLKSLRMKCKEDERVPSITAWGPPSIPNTPVVGRSKVKHPESETTSDSSKESQNELRYLPSKFRNWDEIQAIKPASHQTIRHSSSCSLASGPAVPSTSYTSNFNSKSKELSQRAFTLDSRYEAASRLKTLPLTDVSNVHTPENVRSKFKRYKRRNVMEVNDDFIDDEFNLSLFEQPHMQLSVTSSENLLDDRTAASSIDIGSSSSNEDYAILTSSRNRSTSEEDKCSEDNNPRFMKSKSDYPVNIPAQPMEGGDSYKNNGHSIKETFAKEKNLFFKTFYNGKIEQDSSGDSESDLFKPLKSPNHIKGHNSIKRNLEKNVNAYLPNYTFYTDSEGETS